MSDATNIVSPDKQDNTMEDAVVKTKQPFLKRGQGVQRRLQFASEGKKYVPKGGFVYNTGDAEDDPNNRPSKTFLFKYARLHKQPVRTKEAQVARTRPVAAPPVKPACLQVSTFTRLNQRSITAAAVPDNFDHAVLQEIINHSQQRAADRRPAPPDTGMVPVWEVSAAQPSPRGCAQSTRQATHQPATLGCAAPRTAR